MTTAQHPPATRSLPGVGVHRNPWIQWTLTVVTLGVYGAIAHHRLNRELQDFGVEVDPLRALLAYFPGALLVVPYLATAYCTARRIAVAQETAGLVPTVRPELAAITALFAFLHVPYQQSQLNRVWEAEHEDHRPPFIRPRGEPT